MYSNILRRYSSARSPQKVGSVNGNKFAVKGKHILSQLCYLRDLAVHSVAVCRCASAEGEPAYAIFVNAHARVKGRGAILQPRHILINQSSPSGSVHGPTGSVEVITPTPLPLFEK